MRCGVPDEPFAEIVRVELPKCVTVVETKVGSKPACMCMLLDAASLGIASRSKLHSVQEMKAANLLHWPAAFHRCSSSSLWRTGLFCDT